MVIDLIIICLLVFAVFKGYQRGLIVGIFSLVSIVIGLAAAIKLSTLVAGYIGKAVNISEKWLPAISFAAVFILVVILVRLGANALQKTIEFAMLGWLNRLGGILFYTAIYLIVFSILLFYAQQLHILKPDSVEHSGFYSYVQPWGPRAINSLGTVIPYFKDMFTELEHFFNDISKRLPIALLTV